MDQNERRRVMKAVGSIIDTATEVIDGRPQVTKVAGDGWQAYVYEPAGPDSRTLHIEIKTAQAA